MATTPEAGHTGTATLQGARARAAKFVGGQSLRGARRRTVAIMMAPWVIGFFVFLLGPLVASFVLAFTRYNIFTPPRWAGLDNIREIAHDDAFWHAWKVTLVYSIVGTVLILLLGLATALLIYHARHATGLWRVIYYFPALLGGASEAYVMLAVWTPDFGLVNGALSSVGISGPGWIVSEAWAMPAIILMRYWTIGTLMLLFLGARASVSMEYYEAAIVDGAKRLQQFRYVTLPMMSPIILVTVILGIIGSLQAFTQVFIMTRGGPLGATELIGLYIYREAFENIRMGYGSAISWSLFLVTLGLTVLVLLSSRRWVHYEEGGDNL